MARLGTTTLLLVMALVGCSESTGGVFERVTGSRAKPGDLVAKCSNYPSTDGSSFQLYALPAEAWSPESQLSSDHPLPTQHEKSWVRQVWKKGALQKDNPIVARIALEGVEFAAQGECFGEEVAAADKAIRAAAASESVYYAFLHKQKTAPDQIPVMRLYLIDEDQSLFAYLSDDR
jgi:hypothetical protein